MGEAKVYKCIKEMNLPKYDMDESFIENEWFTVKVDTEWEQQDFTSMSDVRLENGFGWIEITFEDFKNHFKAI